MKLLADMDRKEFVYECAARALAARAPLNNSSRALALQAGSQSRRGFEGRLVACRESATLSADQPDSPGGRDLKRTLAVLCFWPRTMAIAGEVRLATARFRLPQSMRGVIQRCPANPTDKPSIASMVRDADKLWHELQEWREELD